MFIRGGNIAWELFYGLVTPKTLIEVVTFPVWVLLDLGFTTTYILYSTPIRERRACLASIVVYILFFLSLLLTLTIFYPDDGQQLTAYWTGILLELPIGWFELYALFGKQEDSGLAIATWYVRPHFRVEWAVRAESFLFRLVRILGIMGAYGTFFWRYLNVPENWAYVGSSWTIVIALFTILPEAAYPFLLCWIKMQEVEGIRSHKTGSHKRNFD